MAASSPSLSGKHVMLSGRFTDDKIVTYMKTFKRCLEQLGFKTFMVDCGPGEAFSAPTMTGMYRAWAMVVFGTSEYGAKTGAGYETYHELQQAHEKKLLIIPIQLCNTWPPTPTDHDGGDDGAAQNEFVLRSSVVRLIDKKMEMPEKMAEQIASQLHKAQETLKHQMPVKAQEPTLSGHPPACSAEESRGHGSPAAKEPSAGYPKATADPAEAKQWFDLGFAGGGAHEGQRFTQAECYAKAIEADPNRRLAAMAWNNLGNRGGGVVFAETHSKKDCYLKALEVDPKHANAWTNLGNQGGGTVAGKAYTPKECYMKALEFDPKYANAWNNLGHVGGGTVGGKMYTPKECYVRALELNPKISMAWTNFGNAGGGTVSGQAYTPKECHQKALQLDPNNKLAQERLAKC